MTREEARIFINSQEPDFLPLARAKGYVCPKCNNGTGADGTGLAKRINGHYKCFRCGLHADVIELFGIYAHKDRYFDRLEGAATYYGIQINNK